MLKLPDTEHVTDVVWLQTSFIGDVVLTTAALELAAQALPQVKQHVITTRVGAQILGDHPTVATCIVFDKRRSSLPSAFRAVRKDLAKAVPTSRRLPSHAVVLQAHRSFRSSLLTYYLGLPTVAYDEADAAWLASVTVPRVAVMHEAHRIAMLLEPLGVPRSSIIKARPKLGALGQPSSPVLQQELLRLRGQGVSRWIAMAPGSVWGTKRWTEGGFAALSQQLLRDQTVGIVLIGTEAEAAVAASIAKAMLADQQVRIANFAGRTSLKDLRWLLPQMHLLVANDSSPIHFASAFNIPTVGIFGATIPAMGFAPLAERSQTCGLSLPCRPCSDHGPQTCPLGHFQCMRNLSAEQVYAACINLSTCVGMT